MITVYQTHQNSKCEPHFAQDNGERQQWLGDGYYFWEHILFAQVWKFKKKERKIYCANIPFLSQKDKFIDLHSNTENMIEFDLILKRIKQELERRNINKNPTLNEIITILHRRNFFEKNDYIGIRFGSPWHHIQLDITNKTKERFYSFQKIQFCIFEFAEQEIKDFQQVVLKQSDKELFVKYGI